MTVQVADQDQRLADKECLLWYNQRDGKRTVARGLQQSMFAMTYGT